MDSNLKIILTEFEDMKGQFVITGRWEVERLVAISSDDWDYYYVTYDGRKLKHHTCVGRVVKLKDCINKEHYNEFIRLAKLNHYDQHDFYLYRGLDNIPLAIQEHKTELMSLKGTDKFLTEFCWELE